MRRRTWLGFGIASGLVLAAGGGALALWRPGWDEGRLTPAGRELFAAVARVVLEGLLPDAAAAPAAHAAAVDAHLGRLEATLAGLPPAVQAEAAELAALLLHPAGRRLFAGLATPWPQATTPELRAAMQGLRSSSLALRQQVFHALRDLTNGAWFAAPATWRAIGYPGPIAI